MKKVWRLAQCVVAAALMAAFVVVPPVAATAGSNRTLYVLGTGFYTSPALGGALPPQTYMKVPEAAVIDAWNKAAGSKFKVSYSFCDDQMTPTGSQACARQAVSPTGCSGHACDVVFDVVDLNDQASMPEISAAGIPIVGMDVNSPAALDAKNMFCLTGTLKADEQGLVGVLKSAGVTKAGVIGYVEADDMATQNWITEALQKQHIALSAKILVPQIDTNPGSAISTVVTKGTNGVIEGFGTTGLSQAIEYTKNTFPNVKMAVPSYSVMSALLHGVPAKDIDGVGVAAWNQPISAMSVPGVKEYWNQIGHTVTTASGFRYYDNELLSWLGTKFIINVANTVHGTFSPKSMLGALQSAKNINMYGVMPPYSSANRGKNGAEPCSPYFVGVQETMKSIPGASIPVQVAKYPGVFTNPLTGKVVYVDPGFKAPKGS